MEIEYFIWLVTNKRIIGITSRNINFGSREMSLYYKGKKNNVIEKSFYIPTASSKVSLFECTGQIVNTDTSQFEQVLVVSWQIKSFPLPKRLRDIDSVMLWQFLTFHLRQEKHFVSIKLSWWISFKVEPTWIRYNKSLEETRTHIKQLEELKLKWNVNC